MKNLFGMLTKENKKENKNKAAKSVELSVKELEEVSAGAITYYYKKAPK